MPFNVGMTVAEKKWRRQLMERYPQDQYQIYWTHEGAKITGKPTLQPQPRDMVSKWKQQIRHEYPQEFYNVVFTEKGAKITPKPDIPTAYSIDPIFQRKMAWARHRREYEPSYKITEKPPAIDPALSEWLQRNIPTYEGAWKRQIMKDYPPEKYVMEWTPEGATIQEIPARKQVQTIKEPGMYYEWQPTYAPGQKYVPKGSLILSVKGDLITYVPPKQVEAYREYLRAQKPPKNVWEWLGLGIEGLKIRAGERLWAGGIITTETPARSLIRTGEMPKSQVLMALEQVYSTQEWIKSYPTEPLPYIERTATGKQEFVYKKPTETIAESLEPVKLPIFLLSEIESYAYPTPSLSGAIYESVTTGKAEPLQEYYEIAGPWGTAGSILGMYVTGKAFGAVLGETWKGVKGVAGFAKKQISHLVSYRIPRYAVPYWVGGAVEYAGYAGKQIGYSAKQTALKLAHPVSEYLRTTTGTYLYYPLKFYVKEPLVGGLRSLAFQAETRLWYPLKFYAKEPLHMRYIYLKSVALPNLLTGPKHTLETYLYYPLKFKVKEPLVRALKSTAFEFETRLGYPLKFYVKEPLAMRYMYLKTVKLPNLLSGPKGALKAHLETYLYYPLKFKAKEPLVAGLKSLSFEIETRLGYPLKFYVKEPLKESYLYLKHVAIPTSLYKGKFFLQTKIKYPLTAYGYEPLVKGLKAVSLKVKTHIGYPLQAYVYEPLVSGLKSIPHYLKTRVYYPLKAYAYKPLYHRYMYFKTFTLGDIKWAAQKYVGFPFEAYIKEPIVEGLKTVPFRFKTHIYYPFKAYGYEPLVKGIKGTTAYQKLSNIYWTWRETKAFLAQRLWKQQTLYSVKPHRGITLTRGLTGLPYRGLMGSIPKGFSVHATGKGMTLLTRATQVVAPTTKKALLAGIGLAVGTKLLTETKPKKKEKAPTILHAWTGPQYPSIYKMRKGWETLGVKMKAFPTPQVKPYPKTILQTVIKEYSVAKKKRRATFLPALSHFESMRAPTGLKNFMDSMSRQGVSQTQRIRQQQTQKQRQIQKHFKLQKLEQKLSKPKKKRKGQKFFGEWRLRLHPVPSPSQVLSQFGGRRR